MPNLTTKELTALEDQLKTEQNLIKKNRMYAQTATDPQIKNMCEQIASKHQEHFNKLMSYLN